MLIEFDQTTIANMTAALDTVCKKIPLDKDNHETRKRIADAMVACARAGGRSLNEFQSIGSKALEEITRPPKTGWLDSGGYFDLDTPPPPT
jgi:hypothetical protein